MQQAVSVAPPIAIGVTLMGVRGCRLAVDDSEWAAWAHEIMYEQLVFPEVLVRDFAADVMTLLRPTLNQLWNAAGMRGCADYEDDRRLKAAMRTFGADYS